MIAQISLKEGILSKILAYLLLMGAMILKRSSIFRTKRNPTPEVIVAPWVLPWQPLLPTRALPGNSLRRSTKALATLGFVLVAVGVFCAMPTFWPLPSVRLSGMAAAGGIAVVNSIGNLGGFVGPYIIGYLKDLHYGYTGGFLTSALFSELSGRGGIGNGEGDLGSGDYHQNRPPSIRPLVSPDIRARKESRRALLKKTSICTMCFKVG
jgi:hypothetical protein